MNSNTIQIKQLIEWDFFLNITVRLMLKKMISLQFILPVVLLTIVVVNFSTNGGYNFSAKIYSPLLFFLVYLLVIYPWSVYRNAKSTFESSSVFKELIQYDLNDEYLQVKAESFELKTRWSNIPKIEKIASAVLIYNNKVSAYFIDLNRIDALEKIYFLDLLKRVANANNISCNIK